MATLEELAAAFLGEETQQIIAAENPYYQFKKTPDFVTDLVQKSVASDPNRFDTKDIAVTTAISGLLSGILGSAGNEYQNTLTDRYTDAIIGKETGYLPAGLFGSAGRMQKLFGLQRALEKQKLADAIEQQQKIEAVKTGNELKKAIVKAALDDPYTFAESLPILQQQFGVNGDITEQTEAAAKAPSADLTTLPPRAKATPEPLETGPETDSLSGIGIIPLEQRRAERMKFYRQQGYKPEQAAVAARNDLEGELDADKKAYARIEEQREKAREMRAMADVVDQALDSGLETGGGAELGQFVARNRAFIPFAETLGFDQEREFSGNLLEGVKAKVLGMGRVVGSGAVSDFESKAFLQSGPSLDKGVDANREFARRLRETADYNQDYADFVDEVRSRGGTTPLADRLWSKYERSQPLFIKAKGQIVPNTGRVNYKQFNFATGKPIENIEVPEEIEESLTTRRPPEEVAPPENVNAAGEYIRGIADTPKNIAALFNPGTYKAMVTDPETGELSAEQGIRTVGQGAAMTAGAIPGAKAGAALGAFGGPIGAGVGGLIGAGLGAGAGYLGFNRAEKIATGEDLSLLPTEEEFESAARVAGGATGAGVFARGAGKVARSTKAAGKSLKGAATEKIQKIKGEDITGIRASDASKSLRQGATYLDDQGNIVKPDSATQFKSKIDRAVDIVDQDGFYAEATNNPTQNKIIFAKKLADAGTEVKQAHEAIKTALQQKYDSLSPIQKKQYPLVKNVDTGKGGFNPDFSQAKARVAELKKSDAKLGEAAETYLNREISSWENTNKSYDQLLAKKRAYGEAVKWNKPKDAKVATKQAVQQELHNAFNDAINNTAKFLGLGDDLAAANAKYSAYSTLNPILDRFVAYGTPGILEGSGIFDRLIGAPGRAMRKFPKTTESAVSNIGNVTSPAGAGLETFSGALDTAIQKLGTSGAAVAGGVTTDIGKKKLSSNDMETNEGKTGLFASEQAITLIKNSEGLALEAYADKNDGPTIGYGHLGAKKGQKITKEIAEDLLKQDVSKAETAVKNLVKVPLSQNQFDALVSFVYNVGPGQFAESTLLKKLNAGEIESVPAEFGRWIYDDGEIMNGLIKRRNNEAKLFAMG